MKIDKKEVLRYLRYHDKAVDPLTDKLIDQCIEEVENKSKDRFLFEIFDLQNRDKRILIHDTVLILEGNDIYEHLQYAEKCAIIAVTLGAEIDQRIRYYSKLDLTKSLILDACATARVESLCDEVEDKIKELALNQGYYITNRYSPGYGDFSLEIQPKILNTLNTQVQIGLTVTDSLILIPRKSVTAVIGLTKEQATISKAVKCKKCNHIKNCMYVKKGDYCGIKGVN